VSPYINFTGLLERGANLKAIQVMGVSRETQPQVSALPQFILNNAWQHFEAGKQSIILGQGVADALNVKVGDWVTIMIPNTD
ncbi:lipoprotein-releasing system transmembrane subunit LolE, partial [Escherichia coli]|nr:lipoprotein-releasing system transmembrane subunit LolE [Escherichia coli]